MILRKFNMSLRVVLKPVCLINLQHLYCCTKIFLYLHLILFVCLFVMRKWSLGNESGDLTKKQTNGNKCEKISKTITTKRFVEFQYVPTKSRRYCWIYCLFETRLLITTLENGNPGFIGTVHLQYNVTTEFRRNKLIICSFKSGEKCTIYNISIARSGTISI